MRWFRLGWRVPRGDGVKSPLRDQGSLEKAKKGHEVTAIGLQSWGESESSTDHRARLLYTRHPERANDIVFLNRLAVRLTLVFRIRRARTALEEKILGAVQADYQEGRRVRLPLAYSGCDPVFLHDLSWPPETAGDDFDWEDINRSLRTLRLGSWGQTELLPVKPGDATLRARQRLRLLRARGGVPVSAVRVQASYGLYRPGVEDGAGVVLFTPQSSSIGPSELTELAEAIMEVRDEPVEPEPALAAAVGLARANSTTGFSYHRRTRVALSRVGGAEVYAADLWFHRPFLRQGQIVERGIRCLAEPGDEGGIELLPWDAEEGPAVTLENSILAWNDASIPRLARTISDEQAFHMLPILADALEEAGCTNSEVLSHCRQGTRHEDSCWVVDMVLSSYQKDLIGS
jgi:hypothetical protein